MSKHELMSTAARAIERGRYERAVACYRELESLEPDDGDWARRLGDMQRRLGRTGLAVAARRRAATKYARAGFVARAVAMCHAALQDAPGDPDTIAQLRALERNRPVGIAALSERRVRLARGTEPPFDDPRLP